MNQPVASMSMRPLSGFAAPTMDAVREYQLSADVMVVTAPDSVEAESIRALRSNLMSQHVEQGRRALTIVSPNAEAGCSFVAVNLAVAMAHAGVKTLLIDGNLRDPAIGRFIMRDGPQDGLADLLADPQRPVDEVIEPVLDNLSLLFAGNVASDTMDRLGGEQFPRLVDQLLRSYDLTIIDTPPSNRYADARRIASAMQFAMLVARRAVTFRRDVKLLASELGEDRVTLVGTYLNDY